MACAVLVSAVVLTLTIGVIPLVRDGVFTSIDAGDAVPAFRIAQGVHLLVALVFALMAALWKPSRALSTPGLVVMGVVVLLLGGVLADATLAFGEAGISARTVTLLLVACVAADAFAGVLTITTAFLRANTASGSLTGASGGRTGAVG